MKKTFYLFLVLFTALKLKAQKPTITNFSPSTGAVGSSVTVTGTNFNATTTQNVVFFGATKATVTAASTTSLTVTVPVGATFQPITVLNLAIGLTASSAVPFKVTYAGGSIMSSNFASKFDFAASTEVLNMAMGDLDDDGNSDLVTVNFSANTIYVLRNTSASGSVSFAAKVDVATNTNPRGIAIGDLDGDGKPEVVITNFNRNNVSIYRNTSTSGSISFAAKVNFSTGTGPRSVTIGDYDGDRKPDLAIAHSGNVMSVLRNISTSGSLSFLLNFATVNQGNPAALSAQNLNLQLYSFNDQAIASDIYATCNWGNYALPTGISTGQTNICQGANTNVSLTANCPPSILTTWYNSPTDITPIGTGSPFVQSPTVNSNYFVSCNYGIYNYTRFPANSVKVNPIPSPPIISSSDPLTFCQPGSVTLNSFLANNNALSFVRASNQYVTVPHSASINVGANFTMEAWVNYSGQNSTIIDKGNYDFLWQLNPNLNNSKMGFYTRGTGAWVYSTGTIPQNVWTHVAITLQAGTLTFYINGLASGTGAITFSQDTQPMNIGRQQPTDCACSHFNGTMDELRLWNYARTPSQILANMSSVPANIYGLAAYSKFDETIGTTITDASGNNNTGTFVNSPTRQIPSAIPSNIVNSLWTPSNTTAPSITASTFGTYTATVTNGFGCTNSASVVTSSLSPMPTAQANAYISTGANITLSATGCSGGTGTYTLKWYKSSDNSLVTMLVSPAITTNYYAKCEQALNSAICLSPLRQMLQ